MCGKCGPCWVPCPHDICVHDKVINKGLAVPRVSVHPAWIWRVPFLSIANGLQGSSSLKKEMTASMYLISFTSSKFALFWGISSVQERAGFLLSSVE